MGFVAHQARLELLPQAGGGLEPARLLTLHLEELSAEQLAILARAAAHHGIPLRAGPRAGTARLMAPRATLEALAGELAAVWPAGAETVRDVLGRFLRERFVLTFRDGGHLELGQRCCIVGILNVTPDSFFDGGRHVEPAAALEAARRMVAEGAQVLDVGGESTRPGAEPVPLEEELRRVLPVVAAIKRELPVRVCVDTSKAEVARRALEAGADMINDVTALRDPRMAAVAAEHAAPVVLMHMRGTPRTMQLHTHYEDLWSEILRALREALARGVAAGLGDDRMVVDPGIGFGKSTAGNLRILHELATLRSLGQPILVGASRKSFIGAVLDLPVTERLEGSLAAAAIAVWQGAHMLRVHDVAATARVARLVEAIRDSVPRDPER